MSNPLSFELTADGVGFLRVIDGIEKRISGLGGKMGADIKHVAAGFASYEAFKGLAESTFGAAKEIRNFSKQADVTTDEVQKLDQAGNKVGLGFEDFQIGLSHMGAARRDAIRDNQQMLDFFNKFGVSLDDLMNPQLRNIDIMEKMASAAKGVDLSFADKQGFRDVFGKGGEKLIAALHELQTMGPIKMISAEDIESLHELEKTWSRLKKDFALLFAPTLGGAARGLSNIFDPRQRKADELGQSVSDTAGSPTDAATELLKFGMGHGGDPFKGFSSLLKFLSLNSGQRSAVSQFEEDLSELKETLKGGSDAEIAAGYSKLADDFKEMSRRGIELNETVKEFLLLQSEVRKQSREAEFTNVTGRDAAATGGNKTTKSRETPAGTQWEQYYNFFDREAELVEKVKRIRFEMLSPMEQQAALQKEINEHLAKAKELESKGESRLALEQKEKAAALNEQLLGTVQPLQRPGVDSSAASGGYINGAVADSYSSQWQQQISILTEVKSNTAKIAEAVTSPVKPPGRPGGDPYRDP